MDYTIGSLWRKWDLHVHSPASFGGDYSTFIDNLSNSEADVIGINDYCTINGYKQIYDSPKLKDKVLFPVIEMRMNNTIPPRGGKIQKSGTNINFHLIFDNNIELVSKIENQIGALKCKNAKGNDDILSNIGKDDLGKITFDYFHVIEELTKSTLKNSFLVWLPYDEYGGIDDIDPNDNFFKIGLIKKTDFIGSSTKNQIEFFLWKHHKFTESDFEEWFDKKYPCIKGSDSHKSDYPFGRLRDKHSNPIPKYCWIKADPTFEGLKQVTREPEARLFIGETPEVLTRVHENRTKYIDSIEINKVGPDLDEVWFDEIKIDFNKELVSIIGNKGKGKSALVDIIGLLGNSYNADSFSFLNNEKFHKLKKSENFEAIIYWESGDEVTKSLAESPDYNSYEKVKYLPQKFVEELCNENQTRFEKELKSVIFSHVDEAEKSGFEELDGLINQRTEAISQDINRIKSDINSLNTKIIKLERKSEPDYAISIESKLEEKRSELKAHEETKPEEVKKPNESEEVQEEIKEIKKKLEDKQSEQKTLEEKIEEIKKEKIDLIDQSNTISQVTRELKTLEKNYNQVCEKYETDVNKIGIKFEKIVTFEINQEPLKVKEKLVNKRLDEIKELLNEKSEDSLVYKLSDLKGKINNLQNDLDEPSKKYEKYKEQLKKWKKQKDKLIGDSQTEDTIKYYEGILEYIQAELRDDINSARRERKEKVEELYDAKNEINKTYKNYYEPVTNYIKEYKDLSNNYNVTVNVTFKLESFIDRFCHYLNQGMKGSFYGLQDGVNYLKSLIKDIDFNNKTEIVDLLNTVIESLEFDKRPNKIAKTRVIEKQIRNGYYQEFYDFLFSLEYLVPTYQLKLDGKEISELSPGERGALLLIFYLILDLDDKPLIIDQPEENLDNQSVYNILVKFMKEAKKRRQIIIVTHNPNLAVVCDAEQIIRADIDKPNGYIVSYEGGAIENPKINNQIVKILEGTMPAFDLRDKKYSITKLKSLYE